ncbi:MAG TPA: trypsin-like peptidase domain-containing protein [Polyangiaceae bacterium]|nr:trypsin-like peptidase domain-containing protein [Polyangiaceae bacterium]
MRNNARAVFLVGALAFPACASHSAAEAGKARPADAAQNGAASARPPVQSPADITAHAMPAIVSVRAGDAMGTGFVVRADGWVATNFHVVRGASEISVVFANHKEFPVVEIMNANRTHDLVILRIDATALPVLAVGDSDAVRPGDAVLAIGHPLGLEDTVSNGLVSAVRHVHDNLDVLQVSAPIAPGSSGGPLLNDRGEVIGVATAFLTGGQNLNFGLPSKYVKEMVENPHPISMSLFSAAMVALQNQAVQAEHVGRQIPHHPPSLLNGCSDAQKLLIFKTLQDAIEVGAPLYNEGKIAACYQIYEGAAADLAQRLSGSCSGPKRALNEGRKRAAKLADPNAQAWAMRDSFDGMLELLEHSAH